MRSRLDVFTTRTPFSLIRSSAGMKLCSNRQKNIAIDDLMLGCDRSTNNARCGEGSLTEFHAELVEKNPFQITLPLGCIWPHFLNKNLGNFLHIKLGQYLSHVLGSIPQIVIDELVVEKLGRTSSDNGPSPNQTSSQKHSSPALGSSEIELPLTF
ncbi:hypothetical protein Salat_2129100 [Sesamum alatum]|uniref:Uncharacterized protein n=1 Tax=Sesamum alatum TaxID=300844 RepID=A0AAE1Y155_9LAMI|nr:hypothetical protein Salat_2129100 [Sesamum alatum]